MSYLPNNDFGLDAARGRVPGVSTLNKFGRAPAGVQTTSTDIWTRADAAATQPIWLAPTAARIHAIVSTSANDTNTAGTGARTIRIWGLTSWSTSEVSEDIILNGTTPVNTVNSYVIIYRMKVLTSGSAAINAGKITATAAVNGTITAEIDAPGGIGQGQTQCAFWALPSTQTFYLRRFYAYCNDTSTTPRAADLQLRVNENPDVQTTNFINKYDLQLTSTGSSVSESWFEIPVKISGPAIIKVQGIASVADIDISAGFDGYIVYN